MSDEIVFSAQVGKWICVKKKRIKPDTEGSEISRILASIHDSMDRKIWEYLKDEFPLEEFDKIVYEITNAAFNAKKKKWELKGRKSEAQIAQCLAKLNSPNTTKKIKEAIGEDKSIKHKIEVAKSYITRKTLEMLGFRIELDPKILEKCG